MCVAGVRHQRKAPVSLRLKGWTFLSFRDRIADCCWINYLRKPLLQAWEATNLNHRTQVPVKSRPKCTCWPVLQNIEWKGSLSLFSAWHIWYGSSLTMSGLFVLFSSAATQIKILYAALKCWRSFRTKHKQQDRKQSKQDVSTVILNLCMEGTQF